MSWRKRKSKKSKPSYLMSIIGVALVLFLLGILGIIVVHARKLSTYFKEQIELQVILKDSTAQDKALALQTTIQQQPFAKSVDYTSKDQAAKEFKKDFGEDFISILKYNPLYSSIDFKANADYVNKDSLNAIEQKLLTHPIVKEVYYQRSLVHKLDKSIKRLGLIVLASSILLGLVVIVLIDNTIRLAMFSNRFLIKTMQMVGATRWFIAKPFDLRSILNGFLSAVLAIVGLIALMSYARNQLPQLRTLADPQSMILLFVLIIFLGICISLFSTHRSVIRYLKMKLDDLY